VKGGDRGSTLQIANIEFSRFQQVGDLHNHTECSLKRLLQTSCSLVCLDPAAIEDFYITFSIFLKIYDETKFVKNLPQPPYHMAVAGFRRTTRR
jgi:hypothetical protein